LEAGAAAIATVRALAGDIGLTKRLADLGVSEAAIPILSRNAMHDACMATNPRETSVETITQLFYAAM
ncbi:MAG: iron-containing alcohol dehydrogenase, partial [Chloroflexales bacterium]|nr:iron-containing alcohol dehydrogenase [Chloroflexales bacterium]